MVTSPKPNEGFEGVNIILFVRRLNEILQKDKYQNLCKIGTRSWLRNEFCKKMSRGVTCDKSVTFFGVTFWLRNDLTLNTPILYKKLAPNA